MSAAAPVARAPWLDRHWHHVALLLLAAVCGLRYRYAHGLSWHFFATGARSLLCVGTDQAACGLHVYAAHPELQIGPLSFVAAALVVWWPGDDGLILGCIAMMCAGLLALAIVEYDAYRSMDSADRPRLQRRVFLAGLVFIPVWADLAVHFAHLDDVLALVFTAWAVRAVSRNRPVEVGIALSLATISKPWAIAFLPLAFALPSGRLKACLWAIVPPVLVAFPFLMADPHTMTAAGFGIANAPSSSLRLLGVQSAVTPQWDRPVQFLLGLVLGGVAVLRGRAPAVVMLAATARIMLDPGVYSYYTAAILLGAVIWDLQARRGRIFPAWTWLVFAALFAARYLPVGPTVLGAARLAVCLGIIVCALVLKRPAGDLLSPARAKAWTRWAVRAEVRPTGSRPPPRLTASAAHPAQRPRPGDADPGWRPR
ncbi:MAG: hypothetical protein QOH99_438 [Frankiaceae bacterium]|nr:hypothetical protein [Frankiaceae bacterium]